MSDNTVVAHINNNIPLIVTPIVVTVVRVQFVV